MKQIKGQIDLFEYMEELQEVHPVEIMGICDDAFCPVCGDGIDEFKWMDCERCPSCGTRISWEPWHRMNDEDNLNLFGEIWEKGEKDKGDSR